MNPLYSYLRNAVGHLTWLRIYTDTFLIFTILFVLRFVSVRKKQEKAYKDILLYVFGIIALYALVNAIVIYVFMYYINR